MPATAAFRDGLKDIKTSASRLIQGRRSDMGGVRFRQSLVIVTFCRTLFESPSACIVADTDKLEK